MSGGRNTVILDDIGMPSVVVPFQKLLYSDVIEGGTSDPLSAFVIGDNKKVLDVIYVSKYPNIVVNGRAYSLPMKDPASWINFNRAVQVCHNKGNGWHLMTNATWGAISTWCKKNGTMPHGNNNYGSDISYPHEKGVPTADGITTTGSGPSTWYHNYDTTGIADLTGDTSEWCSGLRVNNGEINIIPHGNAMLSNCDMSATSIEWKAIMPDGTLVAPGTAGTVGYGENYNGRPFASITTTPATTGNGAVLLEALGLLPHTETTAADYGNDAVWIGLSGERMPYRGGDFLHAVSAGVFTLHIDSPRSSERGDVGFRSAYYKAS